MTGFVRSFFYPIRGFFMVLTDFKLFFLSLIPIFLSVLIYFAIFLLLWRYSGQWFDAVVAQSSNEVLETLRWVLYWIFLALLGVGSIFGFVRISRILASPFLDSISLRVEKIINPNFVDQAPPSSILKEIFLEIKKLIISIVVAIFLLILNLVVPGLGVILGLLLALRAIAKDFLFFPMVRRNFEKSKQKIFMRKNFGSVCGFAVGSFLFLMVPLISIFAIPACVAAATLLFSRRESGP